MAIGWKDRSMEKEFTVLEPKNSLDSGKRVSLKRNLSDNFFYEFNLFNLCQAI